MSHFTVAVITPLAPKQDIEDAIGVLLAPYQENNMGNCPREYLEFNDEEAAAEERWENGEESAVRLPDGKIVEAFDDQFYQEVDGRRVRVLPEGAEEIKVPIKQLNPDKDAYVKYYAEDYSVDPETGKRGYWENPNRKWDWYTIGGRWSDLLMLKDGTQADYAKIKDIFFVADPSQTAPPANGEISDRVIVNGMHVDPKIAPLLKETVKEFSGYWDKVMAGESFYKPAYYEEAYGSKENYVLQEGLLFSTYAVVTPDGKWHEKGKMGWFGMSSETPEEASKFATSYFDTFIRDQDPELYLVVVDCHI